MTFLARLRPLGLIATLAVLAPIGAAAQATGSITGMVTTRNLQPLSGAQVYVPGTGLGGLTNAQGRFLIPNVPTRSAI